MLEVMALRIICKKQRRDPEVNKREILLTMTIEILSINTTNQIGDKGQP